MSSALSRPARVRRHAIGAALVAGVLATGLSAGPPPALAHSATASFADLVEAASPAVVQITTTGVAAGRVGAAPQIPEHFREGPFRDFFERHFGDRSPDREPNARPRMQGLGSGFIIDADGLVVTNNHVIDGARTITVVLGDGRELQAEVVGTDAKTDLAVLHVRSDAPLPAVAWGESDNVRVGDWVVAMGNPFGLNGTVTAGIVSARGRNIGAGPYDDFIQIDAPINRGNSGGPLFDVEGRVVGVNTAIFSPSGGNVGIGFAIPAAIARDVVADLVESGRVERGWLGVMIQPVTPDIAESLGLDAARGALVARVEPNSPAAAAGLRPGDVVTSFGDTAIDDVRDLTRAAAAADIDRETDVTVLRNGRTVDLAVTVGSPPAATAAAEAPDERTLTLDAAGLAVAGLDPAKRARFGVSGEVDGVVVVDVEADSDAARKGVRPGDVIIQANGVDVVSPADLGQAIDAARVAKRESVLVLIERDGTSRFVALPTGHA